MDAAKQGKGRPRPVIADTKSGLMDTGTQAKGLTLSLDTYGHAVPSIQANDDKDGPAPDVADTHEPSWLQGSGGKDPSCGGKRRGHEAKRIPETNGKGAPLRESPRDMRPHGRVRRWEGRSDPE